MSEIRESNPKPSEEEEVGQIPYNQDLFLTQIAEWANQGLPIPITLSVNGQLITGVTCSVSTFLRKTAEAFNEFSLISEENKKLISDTFIEKAKEIEEDKSDDSVATKIHLAVGKVMSGNIELPSGGTYMRINLSSVDAYSMGMLSTMKSK